MKARAASAAQVPPVLTVLIVNYNGRHLLDACLASVAANVSVSHEVVVVDNASHDGSAEYLARVHPHVVLVRNERNAGFAGGNNVGARHARGRLLLLLNTDTIVRGPIAPLVAMFERDSALGALGCRLVYGDGRQQESIGYEPTLVRLPLSWLPLGPLLPRTPVARRTVPAADAVYRTGSPAVDWVSGAFLMTPRAEYARLGGLDETFFMYMEDADYCRRVRDAGMRVAYTAACETVHLEGAGRAWVGERAVLDTAASYLAYWRKHHGRAAALLLALLLAPVFALRCVAMLAAACTGHDRCGIAKARAFARAAVRVLVPSPRAPVGSVRA